MSDDLRPDFDRHPRTAHDQAWEQKRAERLKAEAERQQQEEAQPRGNGTDQEARNGGKRPNSQDNGARRRFKPVRFKDVEFDPAVATDIVKGLIPAEALIVVWGPPKCGKSFLVYDLAMHVARGQPYRGRHVAEGAVVYVACEGERGLHARTEAYRRNLPEGDNPAFYLITTRLDLVADIKELIHDIRAELDTEIPALIVIDTLNRSIAGSENDPKDMTAYIRATDQLREGFGSSVILIHHCGIEGTRPRGFTGLSGAADVQVAVKRDAAKNIVATVEFMKDGAESDEILSRLRVVEIGTDADKEPLTSCVIEPVNDNANEPIDNTSEKSKSTKQPKLSDKQQIAIDTLRRAIGAHGEPAPGHNHIPSSATVIPVDLWRRFYLQGTSVDGQEENTRRKAWRDARDALLAKKIIGLVDEIVWLT
jgi:AAA domain